MIKSAYRAEIAHIVEQYVARLRREHPEIQRVIWFGSCVTGIPMPGSDVDLCLIISHTDKPRQERSVEYLPVGFPVGMGLFVYTEEEFTQLAQESPGWFAVIQSGREM